MPIMTNAAFNEDRGELLECLPKHDIEYVVNIGSDSNPSRSQ